ncbi:MAG: EAL domain-containing protein [Xanthomonadales bacterium]|nr:EAL domain-containing protein [Xanthomonadales bacterium]
MSRAKPGSELARSAGTGTTGEMLGRLERAWLALVSAWDVEGARALAHVLDLLVEKRRGVLAERAADFAAYLATFADGSLIPNRSQIVRLNVLAHALCTTSGLAEDAAAPAPHEGTAIIALPAAAPRPSEARNTVCVLDLGDAAIPGLADALAERGFLVQHFADTESLAQWLRESRPAALVLDALRLRALPRLGDSLGEAAPGSPLGPALIVLSNGRDLTHRLLAMRAGAAAFFAPPLDGYRIVSRIEELLGRDEATPFRVLLADADREHASQCGRWLVEQGMTARLAFDAQSAITAASEFRPDIALIDFDLPDARGFELAQVLHHQPEFATLPIVLIGGGELDDAQRFDAIAAGADEVLVKPLRPRHLTSVIRSRVRRAQWLRGQAEQASGRDGRTGLYLRQHLVERLGLATLPLGSALLFVAIDRVESVREAVGLAGLAQFEQEVARVFREAMSGGDVAAPIRDYAWAILVSREHRDQVTELAERIKRRLAEGRAGSGEHSVALSASVGITQLDDAGAGVDARVARAEAAALAAARIGVGRALWYEPADYALVRPDPQLAVRAVLSRPLHDGNARVEFRPLVPLAGRLGGQFDLELALVSTQDPGARAGYPQYAPVAHELKVLSELERRRFEVALESRADRLGQGRQVRLFMPIDAQSLLDGELVDWLLASMRERKLAGAGFTFELASRDLLDRRQELAGPMRSLRMAGVRLGLSDYGRDWAAVHMLTTLPLDFLRLDAELVQHTSTDKALNHTLLALVRKAHQLGAAVIAPGIESLERAHVLLRLGIDYGVGDGLGRSLATPDFDFNRPIW